MKNMIYSNRNDEMFKELRSSKFDFKHRHKDIQSTINKISNLFDVENNAFNEKAETKQIMNQKKKKNYKNVGQISGLLVGSIKNPKGSPIESSKITSSFEPCRVTSRQSTTLLVNQKVNSNLLRLHSQLEEVEKKVDESKDYLFNY